MGNSDVLHLIDILYEMVDDAKDAPLSRGERCIISRTDALDVLGELRSQLPQELKKAQELIQARDDYVAAAKREAERIRQEAAQEAKAIVSESRITQEAKERSNELVRRAEEQARNVMRVSNEYAEDVLTRAEEALQLALAEMQGTHAKFRAASGAQAASLRAKLGEGGKQGKG